jgi:hypothetical protein
VAVGKQRRGAKAGAERSEKQQESRRNWAGSAAREKTGREAAVWGPAQ